MKKRFLLIACSTFVVAACHQGADAKNTAAGSSSAGSSVAYKVAGVSVGDTVSKVEADLKAAGFMSTDHQLGWNFDDRVRVAVNATKGVSGHVIGKSVTSEDWKNGGETVSVDFVTNPGENVAFHILYKAPVSMKSVEDVKADLTKRFGKPSYGETGFAGWCGKYAGRNACDQHQSYMTVGQNYTYNVVEINLFGPLGMGSQDQVDAAAKAQGGSKKSSF